MDVVEQAIRLAVAMVVGGAIGFEREIHEKSAGFRTHLLVAIGSATFVLISEQAIVTYANTDGAVQLDPLRTLAGLIGGIGFLGAGAILRERGSVRGLTTAASLWVAAALGAAAGFGYYASVGLATAAALIILVPLHYLEVRLLPTPDSTERESDKTP